MAKWSIDFEKLAEKIGADLNTTVQESIIHLFNRVVLMSPVDTGRFRANWVCSLNNIDTKTTDSTDVSDAIGGIEPVVLGMKLGDTVFLANSLPYAIPLENGWSGQAPSGMVRVSAMQFQADIEAALKG